MLDKRPEPDPPAGNSVPAVCQAGAVSSLLSHVWRLFPASGTLCTLKAELRTKPSTMAAGPREPQAETPVSCSPEAGLVQNNRAVRLFDR